MEEKLMTQVLIFCWPNMIHSDMPPTPVHLLCLPRTPLAPSEGQLSVLRLWTHTLRALPSRTHPPWEHPPFRGHIREGVGEVVVVSQNSRRTLSEKPCPTEGETPSLPLLAHTKEIQRGEAINFIRLQLSKSSMRGGMQVPTQPKHRCWGLGFMP